MGDGHIDLSHLEYAAQIADEAVKNGPQPCAVIAVADREKTLWTHVSPGADGVGLDSIFLIASITKPIVATAVMQLVEQGKLLLSAPVATYLPEFAANDKGAVTAWHLLTHSSGLEEDEFWGELQAIGHGQCRRWWASERHERIVGQVRHDRRSR